MGELGELRNRVDQAVDRLSAANDTRRRQSQGLMTLLTDLEAKYEARNAEVEHCKQRIEALARENADLSGLVEKLVLIVDTTVSSDDEDPLFRASATAADLVADWSSPGDAAEPVHQPEESGEATGEIGQEHDKPETTADKDAAAEAFAGLDPALRFEDVSDEELAAEQPDDDPEALAAPLTFGVDDDVTIQEIDEPFEVTEFDDDEAAAVLKTAESDAGGIDMPDIDMTDIDMIDIDTTRLYGSDAFDPIQERLSADLDIPEISFEDDEPISRIDPDEDTESSIRAMMARLEKAAARAKARTEESSEAEADEAPAVAAGGGS